MTVRVVKRRSILLVLSASITVWRAQVTGAVQIPDVTSIKLTEEWVDQDGNQVGRGHAPYWLVACSKLCPLPLPQICCATMSFSF